MTILLFLTAISLSVVAAYYAVSGLIAIFAAAVIPIMIMGGLLEGAKLVVASWLYRSWKGIPFLMKSYMTTALVVLMLLTSMGIFGYLSKAHMDQTLVTGDNTLKIELIDNKIAREQAKVDDANKVLAQLDQAVQVLMDFDRIRGKDGAIAVRQSQKEERDSLTAIVDEASDNIAKLQEEKIILDKDQLAKEAEVGPLKYIAELIYGDDAKSHFDEAVRWVIIMIIFVFDPLAVLLLIAANWQMAQNNPRKDWDTFFVEEAPTVTEDFQPREEPVFKSVRTEKRPEVTQEQEDALQELSEQTQEFERDYLQEAEDDMEDLKFGDKDWEQELYERDLKEKGRYDADILRDERQRKTNKFLNGIQEIEKN